MSWMTYYVEVTSRQHEDELHRRMAHPRPTPERIPEQRSESWRRLWGSRLRAGVVGRRGRRFARRTAGRVTPAGR